ncbi:hypothetical protein evm_008815 [Chilo suppressalis]|nr:hypothetical protein evm_008815 [Chilo suppressalis]
MAENDAELPTMSVGAAIKEKIIESIKNMDLLTVLQKMVATKPEDEDSEELREKLKGVLEKYNRMSEEDKATFESQIKEGLATKLSMKLNDPNVLNMDALEEAVKDAIVNQLILVGVVVFIFILLLVFFGYKLYKSIKDKEKRREEKKKAKQMKKKK